MDDGVFEALRIKDAAIPQDDALLVLVEGNIPQVGHRSVGGGETKPGNGKVESIVSPMSQQTGPDTYARNLIYESGGEIR